jgi:hypothetical protein
VNKSGRGLTSEERVARAVVIALLVALILSGIWVTTLHVNAKTGKISYPGILSGAASRRLEVD